jgi:hypothetical protein
MSLDKKTTVAEFLQTPADCNWIVDTPRASELETDCQRRYMLPYAACIPLTFSNIDAVIRANILSRIKETTSTINGLIADYVTKTKTKNPNEDSLVAMTIVPCAVGLKTVWL